MRALCGQAIRPRWLAARLLAALGDRRAPRVDDDASPAAGIPVSNPAHPVIDANWIYAHELVRRDELHLQGRRLRRLPAVGDDRAPGGGTPGDQQQPAAELQRRAGVLHVVEGPRRRRARRSRTARSASSSRQADHLFPTRTLAAQRRRADDPGRDVRRPAGHARESQRLDAGQRRARPAPRHAARRR